MAVGRTGAGGRPPLAGIRVLDLTQTLSGPYGSMLLADLGAEVIKVESPTRPDRARSVPPCWVGGQSAYFLSLNRNKRSVALDLQREDHREAFLRLVAVSDVLFDNFRPGVTDRLGLTEEVLRARNPDLVRCSLSAFGQTGPERDRPGYDYLMQALAGTMDLTGDPEGPPTKYGISVVDHVGGVVAAFAIVSSLLGRARGGGGTTLDISLLDTHLSMLTYLAAGLLNCAHEPRRMEASAHPSLVPAQLFRTSDGYLVIMVLADHFWPPLCEVLDLADLAADPRYASAAGRGRHREELTARLAARLAERTTAEWVGSLLARGVPAAPVQNVSQALSMDLVHARQMIVELEHPHYGSYRAVGNPVKTSTMFEQPLAPAPLLGEHTEEVLTGVAGMTAAEAASIARTSSTAEVGPE